MVASNNLAVAWALEYLVSLGYEINAVGKDSRLEHSNLDSIRNHVSTAVSLAGSKGSEHIKLALWEADSMLSAVDVLEALTEHEEKRTLSRQHGVIRGQWYIQVLDSRRLNDEDLEHLIYGFDPEK